MYNFHRVHVAWSVSWGASFLSSPGFSVFTHIFHTSLLALMAPGFLFVRAQALSEPLHEDFLLPPCQLESGDNLLEEWKRS